MGEFFCGNFDTTEPVLQKLSGKTAKNYYQKLLNYIIELVFIIYNDETIWILPFSLK